MHETEFMELYKANTVETEAPPTVTPAVTTPQSLFDQMIEAMSNLILSRVMSEVEQLIEDKVADAIGEVEYSSAVQSCVDEYDFSGVLDESVESYFRRRFELSDHVDIEEAVSEAVNNTLGHIDLSDHFDMEDIVRNAIVDQLPNMKFDITASL